MIDDLETSEKFKEGDNKDEIKLLQKHVINTQSPCKAKWEKKKNKKEKKGAGTNKKKIVL